MKLLDHLRPKPEWRSEDPVARRAAVGGLKDPALLSEIARQDPDEKVRQKALDILHGIALEAEPEVGLAALAAIQDPKSLVSIARSATHEEVSRGAVARVCDSRGLSSVARHGRHTSACLEALERMTEPSEFGLVARKTEHEVVALTALERLMSVVEEGGDLPDILATIVERARCGAAASRARSLLKEHRPGPEDSSPRRETDRDRQTQLCKEMEEMGGAEGCDELAARISQVREAWVDLVPDVDEDLEERFDRAHKAARDRLDHNRIETAHRRQLGQERTEFASRYLTPREALCQRVESLPIEKIEKEIEAARWEWERLPALKQEEVLALEERFRSACTEAEQRLRAWQEEKTEARRKQQREASREERIRLQAENLAKLEKFCARLEQSLESDTLSLKLATRGLRKIRSSIEDPGPFPTRTDRSRLLRRLKVLQGALYPKVGELRESEEWKLWANARVQEQLCEEVETLRELENLGEVSRRLADIQQRWKKAGTVRQDQAQQLWTRFKAAQDEIRVRLRKFQAEQVEKKEVLCRAAEALAPSTEWNKTANELKRLQAEWKKVGPTRRSQDRQLWERFRKACDEFFNRRKEDLKQRRQEWAKNLEAKEALCTQAEALAESNDWKAVSESIKRLQVDWKKIGPVGKKQSDAVWARFRTACDSFFERFHRRHEIDLQKRIRTREAICEELEKLIPAPAEASGPRPMEPVVEPPPEGEKEMAPVVSLPASELSAKLGEIRKRWEASGPVAGAGGEAVVARFNRTFGRVLSSYPAALEGTELDPAKNISHMENLCRQVEKLVPKNEKLDDTATSPAARLAAQWVEAMAANTIGGGISDESRWRAATEDVDRARSAWQRIGYVPEESRRVLAGRFERACKRFFEHRDRHCPPSAFPKSGTKSGAARRR